MWYFGIDLHATTFTVAVMKANGQVMFARRWATSSQNLREAVEALSGRKRVVFEESTLASWAYRELQAYAEVVVAEPWHNRLIGADEHSTDERAAVKLANLLRMGMIHPVHHTADPARQGFKELVLMYEDAVHEVVRVKTRLKAKFQQQGVRCVGSDVYRAERRAQWLEQLPRSEARYQVELLWDDLEHAVRKCERLRQVVCRRARGIEVIRRFQAVPGIGWIRAALFYVIVDTPQRFAHRRKLWTYCGIGVAQRRSGEQAEPAHLTRRGNPRLKAVAKGAALTAIAAGKNRFAAQFGGLISQGRLPSRARLTVARSLVSTLYEMWRRGTAYREEEDEPTREFTRRRRAR